MHLAWLTAMKRAQHSAPTTRTRWSVIGYRCGDQWCYVARPQAKVVDACPECFSPTEREAGCPTYPDPRGLRWMRCMPDCGDAETFTCTRKGCKWYYARGYDLRNPNHQALRDGQGVRPAWLMS